MSSIWRVTSGLLAVVAAAGLAAACDNGAVGVEACRSIETRKCEVALGCPGSTIVDEGTVSTCKTFYRDQCLFGIADKVEPDPVQIEACVAAIGALDGCKASPTLGECATAPSVSCPLDAEGRAPLWCASTTPTDLSACSVLFATEHLDACAFLRPVPGESGATTTSGTGGGAVGASTGGGGGAGGGVQGGGGAGGA